MKLKTVTDIMLNSQNLNFFLKKNSISLNLQLLKSKIYEKKIFCKNSSFLIEEKFLQLKMILIVIYSYHYFNRTIMFIGVPNKIINTLAKIKRFHIFLPSSIWLNGTFTNKNSIRIYLRYQQLRKAKPSFAINKFLSIIKLPKLVVLLNPVKKSMIISEIYRLRIPVIVLYTNIMNVDKFSYKILTNSAELNLNPMFWGLLSCLFLKK